MNEARLGSFYTATNSAFFRTPTVNDKYNERWMHTSADPPICTQKNMHNWTMNMSATRLPSQQLRIQPYLNPQQWMTNTNAMMNAHIGRSPICTKTNRKPYLNSDTVEQGLQVREASTRTLTSSHLFMHSSFSFFWRCTTLKFKTKFQNDRIIFFSLNGILPCTKTCARDIDVHTSPGLIYKASDVIHDMQ